jgi:hypothetical protein
MPRFDLTRLPPSILAALAASTILLLSACDKNAADPPLPRAEVFPVAPSTPGDTSVPSASSVMTPAEPTPPKDSPPATRSDQPLTKAQESAAMPLGGQANDHSAPKPAEAASAASAP